MWMMLQAQAADDYIVATGKSYSVHEFVEKTFALLDLDPEQHVVIDPRYLRPAEVDHLYGDAGKIRLQLAWEPEYMFDALVERMVEHDLRLAEQEWAVSQP